VDFIVYWTLGEVTNVTIFR